MKNSLIYLFIYLFISWSLLSCTKEDENSNNPLIQTKSLQDDLMKEPLVINMLNDLKSYNIKVNSHGILEFKSEEDINEVMDTLEFYTHKFEDKNNKYPTHPLLLAFEIAYNFTSLRADIESQIVALEQKDNLFEYNDPDNYYIVSEYFRTILTPKNEVIINGLICVYLDNVAVGIMNDDYSTLVELHNNLGRYPHEEQAAAITDMANSSCFLLGEKSSCIAEFTYTQDPVNSLTYYFTNESSSNYFQSISFGWDFGDGYSTTQTDPSHTFTSGGQHIVTLIVYTDGDECSRIEKVININSCNSDFIASESADGKYYFNSTSSSNLVISNYSWHFGDGTSGTNVDSQEHTYTANGTYTVSLIITAGNCTDSYQKEITVDNAGDFCKAGDRETYKYDIYITGSRKAKYVFAARNVWPFHRVIMKTINYKIKSNGSLDRVKADVIGADFYGTFYDTDCNFWFNLSLNTSTHIETNEKEASYNEGIGYPYRIRKGSIISWHKVVDEGETTVGHWLKLHDDE
jgi:PKD repeat protein